MSCAMQTWETPELEEIDMNAEIGGYQPDAPDERGDEPPFVRTASAADGQS